MMAIRLRNVDVSMLICCCFIFSRCVILYIYIKLYIFYVLYFGS